ncbi:MAG: hypothetical protein HN627_01670 [Opitutae bacterium]|nr:hypothetical protein [Opitutae bacterium]
MKKTASILMTVAMSLGLMAFAENQAPDRDFAPDANPNVNPPPGAVQDPGGQRPPPPTFEQWVEGGKRIPPENAFVGGSPWFDESTGKDRSPEEVYKIIFPERPEPGTGGPDPRPEVEKPEDPVAEYRRLEAGIAEIKKIAKGLPNGLTKKGEDALATFEARLAELKKIPEVAICIFPPKPERKPFPQHWGRPPAAQTRDSVELPRNFGKGSSTLKNWIDRNIKSDLANSNKPKPEPKRPPVVLPAKPPRDELPVTVESDKKALMEEMKAKLASLEGASREDTRKAVEEFKEDNEARFAAIKKAADAQKELERPERKERPEPPAAVKTKIEEVKKVEKTLHFARKAVTDKLKEAQDELAAKIAEAKKNPDKNEVEIEIKTLVAEQAAARKAALDHFRAAQKEKHEELKTAQKELREEVRNTKEEGSSRTSR